MHAGGCFALFHMPISKNKTYKIYVTYIKFTINVTNEISVSVCKYMLINLRVENASKSLISCYGYIKTTFFFCWNMPSIIWH